MFCDFQAACLDYNLTFKGIVQLLLMGALIRNPPTPWGQQACGSTVSSSDPSCCPPHGPSETTFSSHAPPCRERLKSAKSALNPFCIILGSLRGEAPHKLQDGGSGGKGEALPPRNSGWGVWGEGRSPSPQNLREGGLGGGAEPLPPDRRGGLGERSPPQLRGGATFLVFVS